MREFRSLTSTLIQIQSVNDLNVDPARHLSTLSVRQIRCHDSCNAVIFKAEKSPSSLHSSVSTAQLAASAVSALLQGATRYEDEPVIHIISPSKVNVDTGGSTTHKRNRNPPDRLPPLIEKLVGSIDPSLDHGSISEPLNHSEVLVRRINKNVDKRVNLNGDKQVEYHQQQMGTADDSVAAIAAAAAAAFFSHQDQYRREGAFGRLRMKTYNDQWEAALRWIASWDEATLESMSRIPKHTASHDRQSASKKSLSSSSKRKKKIKPSSNVASMDTHPNHQNRSKSDVLYETCVQKCLRNVTVSSSSPMRKSPTNKLEGTQLQRVRLLKRIRTLTLGPLQWDVTDALSTFYEDGRLTIFGGIFGIFISSAFLWSIFQSVFSRKLFKTKPNVLLQVLTDKSFKCTTSQGDSGAMRPNKKHSNKKSKRKKAVINNSRFNSHMPVGSVISHEEDSLESDDSYDLSHLRESRAPVKLLPRATVEDISYVRVRTSSCGQTGSITSNSTEDADSQIMAPSSSDVLKQCIYDKPKEVPSRYVSGISASHRSFLNASPDTTSVSKERSLSLSFPKSAGTLSSQTESHGHAETKNHKVEPSVQPLAIPTDEQREEAARNLREFQLMQVKKIMQLKEEKRIQEQLKKQASPVVTHEGHRGRPQDVSILEIASPTSMRSMTLTGSMVDACKMQHGKISEEGEFLLDELSRESFLLSNILDEDDECSSIKSKSSLSLSAINSPCTVKLSLFQQVNVSDSNESRDKVTQTILSVTSFSSSWGQGESRDQGIW